MSFLSRVWSKLFHKENDTHPSSSLSSNGKSVVSLSDQKQSVKHTYFEESFRNYTLPIDKNKSDILKRTTVTGMNYVALDQDFDCGPVKVNSALKNTDKHSSFLSKEKEKSSLKSDTFVLDHFTNTQPVEQVEIVSISHPTSEEIHLVFDSDEEFEAQKIKDTVHNILSNLETEVLEEEEHNDDLKNKNLKVHSYKDPETRTIYNLSSPEEKNMCTDVLSLPSSVSIPSLDGSTSKNFEETVLSNHHNVNFKASKEESEKAFHFHEEFNLTPCKIMLHRVTVGTELRETDFIPTKNIRKKNWEFHENQQSPSKNSSIVEGTSHQTAIQNNNITKSLEEIKKNYLPKTKQNFQVFELPVCNKPVPDSIPELTIQYPSSDKETIFSNTSSLLKQHKGLVNQVNKKEKLTSLIKTKQCRVVIKKLPYQYFKIRKVEKVFSTLIQANYVTDQSVSNALIEKKNLDKEAVFVKGSGNEFNCVPCRVVLKKLNLDKHNIPDTFCYPLEGFLETPLSSTGKLKIVKNSTGKHSLEDKDSAGNLPKKLKLECYNSSLLSQLTESEKLNETNIS